MPTTRTLDERTNLQDRSRRRAIGAHLIVVGALGALAAASLSILMADPGGRVPTSTWTRPSVAAAAPADQDRSWLCNAISDDSGSESRAAAIESLARGGITCTDGLLLDTHATEDR